MITRVLLFFVLIAFQAFSQNAILKPLLEIKPGDSMMPASYKFHPSIQPVLIRSNIYRDNISVTPIIDQFNSIFQSKYAFRAGLGVQSKLVIGKWFAHLGYNYTFHNSDTAFLSPRAYFNKNYHAQNLLGRIAYTPNQIFNFQAGLDRNFIGEGCRSLFLSDYGNPYPFGQIRANFWHVEYTTLYQFFREKTGDNYDAKFAASHYISWNALKNWNIGIFETVVFRPSDTLLNRGFDVEYLNPLIFYRPQEYSLGSSDNILLGLSSSYQWKNYNFYGQFILDEFLLSEIRARSGWWGNKYGFQLGAKGNFSLKNTPVFLRLEANAVRPYTYSHLNEFQNYGNDGLVLAHPYGANFAEVLFEAKVQKKPWYFKLFVSGGTKGENYGNLNFGGDIYIPYVNRPEDYNNYIGQGVRHNFVRGQLYGSYQTKAYDLELFGELNVRIDSGIPVSISPVLGIRKAIWNDYRNY